MTKKFLVFLIGFVFLGLAIFSQTPEENFQKAGQAELAEREAILQQEKAEIEEFFDSIANDAIISGLEMKAIKQMVGEFDREQKQYNKDLEFYGLKTTVEIFPVIRKHLEIYFDFQKGDPDRLYYRDGKSQEIRRYFVEKMGWDIKVEKSDNLVSKILCALGGALLIFIVVWWIVFAML